MSETERIKIKISDCPNPNIGINNNVNVNGNGNDNVNYKIKKIPIRSVFMNAIEQNNVKLVKRLIASNAKLSYSLECPDQYTKDELTPLALAASDPKYESILKMLLEKVVSVDDISWCYSKTFDYDNHIPMTALTVACEQMNLTAVRLLLGKGAEPKPFCSESDDECTCNLLHEDSGGGHDCFEICNEMLEENKSNSFHSSQIRAILQALSARKVPTSKPPSVSSSSKATKGDEGKAGQSRVG